MTRRMGPLALWLAGLAAAAWIVAGAQYVTDLSAFLPGHPTVAQRLLLDELRQGPASRLLLVALDGGDAAPRARIMTQLAGRLRTDPAFSQVDDGEAAAAAADREFLLSHRYLLSDAVTPAHFTADGLKPAISQSIESLAGPAGLLLKSLLPRDPTGELARLVERSVPEDGPRVLHGVWSSADGSRALLAAETAAAGSDTDGQEHAIERVRAAFRDAQAAVGPEAAGVALRISGPAVFAVAARATIKQAATRLSVISGILVIGVLLAVYRSSRILLLGLLPVTTGALVGIACVAVGCGAVHGITLGFGATLIGESVDYSVYFFIPAASGTWRRRLWPTVRLGMWTSVCGFSSLLPSQFPGLAQLGVYSIGGLMAAALVTRFVLPQLAPRSLPLRDVTGLGHAIERVRTVALHHRRAAVAGAVVLALSAAAALVGHRDDLWNRDLAALSPVPPADQEYDARLRADLHAADLVSAIIVSRPDRESALQGAERAGGVLQPLVEAGIIGGFDSPARFLPSAATQDARRSALPDPTTLRTSLREALSGLDLDAERLDPFVRDLEAARAAPLLTRADLQGTSFAAAVDALLLHASGRWIALLPVHPAEGAAGRGVDGAQVRAALSVARLPDTHLLDLKAETDALYAGYLREALRLSLAGGMLIAVLLVAALRSVARGARVLAPLLLAVITVAATLTACGVRLTLLHLVGMLLIVAVGSNYALFFDAEDAARRAPSPSLLAALCVANLCTVIAFGLLSLSGVPVLEALGVTVAPGALLALVFSAAFTASAAGGAHA